MARKKGVNKTEKVLEYWNQHPEATAAEVAEALKKQGTEVKVSYIYNIRTQSRKKAGKKKAGRKAGKAKTQAVAAQAPAATPAPAATEKKAEPAGTVTLEHIKAVAQTIKAIGGFGKLNELVSLIREVGGLRKFKDLVDAITAAGSGAVPF
jgi:hypothetical protein